MQAVVQRRPTLLFLIVLSMLFFLMSRSTRTRYVGETRTLFERGVMTVFAPVPKAVNYLGEAGSDAYYGYLDMRRAVRENSRLRRRVAQLTEENIAMQRSTGELARLRALIGYSEQLEIPSIVAEILMMDNTGRFKSIILNRGSDHGVAVNDPVVNADGLVGRVVLTTRDLSKVQLITDTNSSVGTLVERTRRQGVIRGDGAGGTQMLYVPSLSDVVVGDQIVTAGTDGVHPKGIPVGRVVVAEERTDLFKQIVVRPTVDFGAIEEVLILNTRKIPEPVVRYAP
jgi:rod shape-determining protein MreC